MEVTSHEEWGEFAARLLASIRQPVVVVDTDFRVVYFNEGAEKSLGWTAEEMLGTDIVSAAGIALSDSRAEHLLAELAAGHEVVEDFELTRRDGHRFPVLTNLTPLFGKDGEFVGMVAIATDITDRWAMEDANWRLSAIVEGSSDAIIGYDLDGVVTSWNAAAARLLQAEPGTRVGHNLAEFHSAARFSGPPFSSALEHVRVGEWFSFEGELSRPDGSSVHLECTSNPVRDRMGSIVGGATVARDVTERHRLERAGLADNQRLEEAQQIAQIGSFDLDMVSETMSWSRQMRRIFALPNDEEPSVGAFVARVHPDDRERFDHEITDAVMSGASEVESTYRLVTADGVLRWLHTIARAYTDEGGQMTNLVGSTQDVTERVEQDHARRLAEEQFTVAFELGNVGMLILGLDRQIMRVNPMICRMLGREPDEILGHSPDDFAHPDEVPRPEDTLTSELVSSGRSHVEAERRYLRPDGEVVHTIVHLAVVRDLAGLPVYTVAQVVDITDRKKTEEELERLAMQDALTGLPNRNLLQDRLSNALDRAHRAGNRIAVIFVDVDHFKVVNDSLGHSAGDDLLRQLAHRLGECTRSGDTIARFGGDEFVLVCEDVPDDSEASVIGERVGAVCDEAFLVGEQLMYVTLSCGIVVATPEDTASTLLRDADTAMYRAKERGRARYEIFDPSLRSRTTRRLDIELALRRAIEQGEFHLQYQPIMTLPEERPVAVEALLRWDHPERGLVTPGEFVRAAEETGLIVPIGEWVLEQAIAQTAQWRRSLEGAEALTVCINLSPRQLTSPSLLPRALGSLASHGLPAEAVCLEITESAAMDVDVTIPVLRQISASGISLAVDDFGAGYSSLSRLKRLPVKMLKIDRSFVDGLGEDADDSLIVHAIVSLGNALDLMLCAEGVETTEQLGVLVELNCDRGQGYLWSKPLQPHEFESWWTMTCSSAPLGGARNLHQRS